MATRLGALVIVITLLQPDSKTNGQPSGIDTIAIQFWIATVFLAIAALIPLLRYLRAEYQALKALNGTPIAWRRQVRLFIEIGVSLAIIWTTSMLVVPSFATIIYGKVMGPIGMAVIGLAMLLGGLLYAGYLVCCKKYMR